MSAITSAFVDNIPFTTTMIPVIVSCTSASRMFTFLIYCSCTVWTDSLDSFLQKDIAENVHGVRLEPLVWSLAFGSCLGGMGTLIGASDNVVMAGIAEKVSGNAIGACIHFG
eukprot:COSAG05_NODE_56_length_23335_cov_15.221338_20_plen_112_part_00